VNPLPLFIGAGVLLLFGVDPGAVAVGALLALVVWDFQHLDQG
jgi:hypothetical protein